MNFVETMVQVSLVCVLTIPSLIICTQFLLNMFNLSFLFIVLFIDNAMMLTNLCHFDFI